MLILIGLLCNAWGTSAKTIYPSNSHSVFLHGTKHTPRNVIYFENITAKSLTRNIVVNSVMLVIVSLSLEMKIPNNMSSESSDYSASRDRSWYTYWALGCLLHMHSWYHRTSDHALKLISFAIYKRAHVHCILWICGICVIVFIFTSLPALL